MINLFLLALSVTSFTINGTNSTLIPHNDNSGTVMYYELPITEVDGGGSDVFTIGTAQGSISFEVFYNYLNLGNYHSLDIQFKVDGDSAYSNIYLYNLEVTFNETGQTANTFTLPNVYFLGQPTYYVDNEDGNYTVQIPNTGRGYELFISFDIGLLPSSFVDGSTYQNGYSDGYNSGYSTGVDEGITIGYQGGYVDGYSEASTQNQTAVTIFSGIVSIALIPINFFLACLNFEVFGINIGSFVSALLTVAIVVIITRMIISGGNGGGD